MAFCLVSATQTSSFSESNVERSRALTGWHLGNDPSLAQAKSMARFLSGTVLALAASFPPATSFNEEGRFSLCGSLLSSCSRVGWQTLGIVDQENFKALRLATILMLFR